MTSDAKDYGQWQPLFNGKNLDGWQHVGPGEFVVENGVLKTAGGMGLLWYTKEKFSNSVAARRVQRARAGEGRQLRRLHPHPDRADRAVDAGEQGLRSADRSTARTTITAPACCIRSPRRMAKPELKEWNTMEITLTDDRTVVTLNGEKITDYKEGDPVPEKKKSSEPDRGQRAAAGYIGLQNHNDKDVVLFRDISVKKLK